MELLQLQYFRTVARTGHMTKAAEELHIAQPALSQAISRLEKDIGVPLFDRKGRRIKLNSYGEFFLKKAEKALNMLDEARQELAERAGLEKGSVYLAASTFDRLSAPLNNFLAMYPQSMLRITQTSMDKLTELIHNPEVDFCFTAVPLERKDVESTPVLQEDIYIGVPPEHPLAEKASISLNAVSQEAFVGYRKDHPVRIMNDKFCHEAGFSAKVVCEADEPSEIANLVRAGLGIAFVGSCKLDDDLVKLKVEEPVCRRTYYLVWQKERYLSAAAREFKAFLIRYFSDNGARV